MARTSAAGRGPGAGTFRNGMDYLSWGGGARTLLFIQGGPGSSVPKGLLQRLYRRQFRPFLRAGFAVWIVTRRRHMPAQHTIADIADDYARVIDDEFGGRVDIVLAESFGGMIAQYLAVRRPDSFGHIALVVTAAELSDRGKDVDSRLAAALARGDTHGAGMVFAEYMLPGGRLGWLRRLVRPLLSRGLRARADHPAEDVLTEVRAEVAFDSRPVLGQISRPVLLVCGGSDRFFPPDVASETAGLIPDCTLLWYEGKGHLRVAASGRLARDILAFVGHG
jgi:pimeloyl-ACP methyl ester carboxylesterase